jgi:hypothetical protein
MDAYKAIEAIIGDPRKDNRRFRAQLEAAGLDPDVAVGHRTRRPLIDEIRAFNQIRDTRAGHGTRPRKTPITTEELAAVQQCASYVIYKVARKPLQGPIRKVTMSPTERRAV